MIITHRPRGIEHPYARSADQLVPAIPIAEEPLAIGAIVSGPVHGIDCVITWPDRQERITMQPADDLAADAALLAGGEGHLAAAQEAVLGQQDGWRATLPALPDTPAHYHFEAHLPDGQVVVSQQWELLPARWVVEPRGEIVGAEAKLIPGSIQWLVNRDGVLAVRFALELAEDEHVVGFGERFDAIDQRGRALDAVVFEQYKGQGRHRRTYLPMPFAHVMSERGSWGFHVATSRRTWYDVGASHPGRLVIEVDLGVPGVTVEATQQPELVVNLWQGRPAEVLDAFLEIAGRPVELPEWVFGLWASGNEWNTQQRVMEQLDRHEAEGIPASVVVIEAWSDEESFTVFRDAAYMQGGVHRASDFSYPETGAWPDPAGMIRELHRRGTRVILWQIPLQKSEQGLGPQATWQQQQVAGYAVAEADGSPYRNRGWWFPQALMPDLSTVAGRQAWTAARRYLVADLDVDGFKTDGGEHAWGFDLRYADGRRGDEGNNLYPVHYSHAFGELLKECGKAPVTFSRAGFTGSQAQGVFWAGDEDSTWEAFANSMRAGITAGACGIVYWGWDLAGFSGPVPEAELYARAFGTSAFLPIMQYHSEFNHHHTPPRDRTPWNVAKQTGHPELVDMARHFTAVRETLKGYLVSQTAVGIQHGLPLMRGLFFQFLDDPEIWQHLDQFMLGDELLVHPITKPDPGPWQTYLPRGRWRDFWSGEEYDGGVNVAREYQWDEVPVFRKI